MRIYWHRAYAPTGEPGFSFWAKADAWLGTRHVFYWVKSGHAQFVAQGRKIRHPRLP
jgi:hypothetical protein